MRWRRLANITKIKDTNRDKDYIIKFGDDRHGLVTGTTLQTFIDSGVKSDMLICRITDRPKKVEEGIGEG